MEREDVQESMKNGSVAKMSAEKEMQYRMKTIDEALSLLKALFVSDRRMTLAELTDSSGVSKNKAFRFLKTFEVNGILDKDRRGKYYFGINMLLAARDALSRIEVPEVIPCIEKVALQLNEAVYFACKTKTQTTFVAVANSAQRVTVRSYLGCGFRDSPSKKEDRQGGIDGVTVSVGALDPEVTTVTIDIPAFREAECYALVVVAPTFRMPPEHIRAAVIPVLQDAVSQLVRRFRRNQAMPNFHPETMDGVPKRLAKGRGEHIRPGGPTGPT